mmetsp:Transcript_24918/g.65083  ORF Transcript_24918/g.65083 Transcript_24918/m.65083 type:complete len:210 (+) Transcript_24918:74-703(+)
MAPRKGCIWPSSTNLLCASMVDTWYMSPGKRAPRSVAIQPRVASMQTRPCLSSDSRSHFMSKVSEKPSGSNSCSSPTYPARFWGLGMKGKLRLTSARAATALVLLRCGALEAPQNDDCVPATEAARRVEPSAKTSTPKKGQVLPEKAPAVAMPPKASMASRPFRSSFSCISYWPFSSLGYQVRMPKSPGLRSVLPSIALMIARKPKASK